MFLYWQPWFFFRKPTKTTQRHTAPRDSYFSSTKYPLETLLNCPKPIHRSENKIKSHRAKGSDRIGKTGQWIVAQSELRDQKFFFPGGNSIRKLSPLSWKAQQTQFANVKFSALKISSHTQETGGRRCTISSQIYFWALKKNSYFTRCSLM